MPEDRRPPPAARSRGGPEPFPPRPGVPPAAGAVVRAADPDQVPAGRRDAAPRPRGETSPRRGRRIETDAENVQRDLTKLVLTIVELVRQLVERQCIRRVDQGDLSDEQIEEIGVTLMRLEEAMGDLCDRFGLSPSDLNLDLGPLGTLLPPERPDT